MAEPRKVPFVTISSFSTSPPPDSKKRRREDEAEVSFGKDGAASGSTAAVSGGGGCGSPFGNVKGGEAGDSAEARRTVRLDLSLSEPSDRGSAEFNYSELVQSTQPKDKVKKTPSGPPKGLAPPLDPNDPFADDEKERQEVEALAKKFESKYGNTGKRRRRDRMQDLIDIGYGYDDTDPFIDNSEAYDELVPASLNTKLGGFYINTGTLQFRPASESEGEEAGREGNHFKPKLKAGEERGMKKRRKKDGANMEEKKKNRLPKQGGVSVLGVHRPEKKKRKKLMKDSLNLAAMLRRFSREKDQVRRRPPSGAAPPHARIHANNIAMGDLTSDPGMMSLLGSANNNETLQDMMGDLDFSLLDSSPQPASPAHGENGALGAGPRGGAGGGRSHGGVLPPPPLPGGLPAPLIKRIEDLRAASRQFDQEGRKKFFTLDMNNILLDIELQVQEQPAGVRAAVYSHLEAFVPCNKEALLKRLKKLNLNIQDDRLRAPLLKLKLAVCSVMPEQIARYNMDCIAKVAKQQSEEGEKNGSEEDDEEKPGKRVMGPRKKFIWDDKLRSLLCSLVRVKLGCYELEGQSSLSPEDYLKAFMETEVKPLWPKGWMQARMLFKESIMVHGHLTGNTAKRKMVQPPKTAKPKEGVWVQRATPQAGGPASSSSTPQGGARQMPPSPSEPICLEDDLLNPASLDPISQALALLSSAAKGLVRSESPPRETPHSSPLPRASPLLQQHRQYVSAASSSSSSSPSLSRPPSVSSPLAAGLGVAKGGGAPVQPARPSVLSSQSKTGSPALLPKSRPPPTSSPLILPGARPPLAPPHKACSNNSKASGGESVLSASPQPRPLPSPSLHLQPRPPQPSPGPGGGAQSNFITPMQATLTKSAHSSKPAIIKLTPSSSPSSSSHTRPQTTPSMHQYPSKSPAAFRSAFPIASGQKTPAQTSANTSLTNSSPISKQHSGSSPSPTASSANQGQRQRLAGGATQGAKPMTSVSSSSASSQLPQVSSAGGGLLSSSLGFGMLGGLVPVSLPFPSLINLPSLGTPTSSSPSGSSATASQAAFSSLTQNLYQSLQSGGQVALPPHLQLAFSDVSQSQGGDAKRKSL